MKTYNYSVSDFEKAKSIADYFEDGDIIKVTNHLNQNIDVYEVKTIKSFIKQKDWNEK